jgi:hypothetical protein
MNSKEYLLACLSEELSEVQQCVSKCLRFSPEHRYEEYPRSNFEELSMEFSDVMAIMDLMKELCNLDVQVDLDRLDEKKERTLHYMNVSRLMGTLKDATTDN